MRFRLFPSDLEGVGSYRVLYPYSALEAYGGHDCYVEIDDKPGLTSTLTPLTFPEPHGTIEPEDRFAADYYVFQRRLERHFPLNWPPTRMTSFGIVDIIRWLQSNGKPVVVETDDWMHNLPHGAPALKMFQKNPWLSPDVLRESVRLADIVTVSTPTLADMYAKDNANVKVLPNYLNWSSWRDIPPVYDRDRRVRVGWMGWLKWRGSDLATLKAGGLSDWLGRHQEIDFVTVGDDQPHNYLGVPENQRVTEPYAVFPGHAPLTASIDIGLVPLEYTRFNECKSHLKGLEYAACGIPCIATPTAPYKEWVEEGVNGMLARKPADWTRCLDTMLEGDAWREMGRNARAKAQDNTIQGHWREWETVFENRGTQLDTRPAPVHPALLRAA